MRYLILTAFLVALFLAMPFLAAAFARYCDAVNRMMAGRGRKRP